MLRDGKKIMAQTSLVRRRGQVSRLLVLLNRAQTIARPLGLASLMQRIVLSAVNAYQRYLSPHKGFSCAYRRLHQQPSCSSYFCSCIQEYGLSQANELMQQRLVECRQACDVLASDRNTLEQSKSRQNKRRRRSRSSNSNDTDSPYYREQKVCDCWDLCDVSFYASGCDVFDCDVCDAPDCDVCDCG